MTFSPGEGWGLGWAWNIFQSRTLQSAARRARQGNERQRNGSSAFILLPFIPLPKKRRSWRWLPAGKQISIRHHRAGRARHSVRAAACNRYSERRARSDAPYHVTKLGCHGTSSSGWESWRRRRAWLCFSIRPAASSRRPWLQPERTSWWRRRSWARRVPPRPGPGRR